MGVGGGGYGTYVPSSTPVVAAGVGMSFSVFPCSGQVQVLQVDSPSRIADNI